MDQLVVTFIAEMIPIDCVKITAVLAATVTLGMLGMNMVNAFKSMNVQNAMEPSSHMLDVNQEVVVTSDAPDMNPIYRVLGFVTQAVIVAQVMLGTMANAFQWIHVQVTKCL